MSQASEYSGRGEVPPGESGAGAAAEVGAGLVRVIKGSPDEAELAALVAGIVAARAAGGSVEPEEETVSAWADRGRRLGLPTRPGRDAWRWSARPY